MIGRRACVSGLSFLISVLIGATGAAAQFSFQQQSSPLRGQGVPGANVSENIYISVFLDRLLGVDELNYRFDAVLYTYVTWVDENGIGQWLFNNIATNCADPSRSDFHEEYCSTLQTYCRQLRNATGTAQDAVRQRGKEFLGAAIDKPCQSWKADGTPSRTSCQRYCSNQYNVQDCCDGIFIPDINLANLYSLSQDFTITTQLMPQYDNSNSKAHYGAWMWSVHLHGTFFLRMNFRKFPWDHQQLLIHMRYDHDNTMLNTSSTLVPSSSGVLTLRPQNGGDDSSGWHVNSVRMEPYVVHPSTLVRGRIEPPADGDPSPLFQTAVVDGQRTVTGIEPVFASRLSPGNSLLVVVEVSRYYSFFIVNMVAPIILTTMLGFFVFLLSVDDMEKRLVLLVTLFLALTALQFVVSTNLPSSSYVLKTQALVLTGYALFMAMALESWGVYFLGTAHHRHKRLRAWQRASNQFFKGEISAEALQQVTASVKSGRHPGHTSSPLSGLGSGAAPGDEEDLATAHITAASQAHAQQNGGRGGAGDTRQGRPLERQPTLLQRVAGRRLTNAATLRLAPMIHDADYAEWFSRKVDRVALVFLVVAYVAILIAVLVS